MCKKPKNGIRIEASNIVHLYNIDRDSGVDFIAMEYVAGKTLYYLIGRKGLKTAEALHYAMQIADALAGRPSCIAICSAEEAQRPRGENDR